MQSSIQELLDLTEEIEIPADNNNVDKLKEMYGKHICSTNL